MGDNSGSAASVGNCRVATPIIRAMSSFHAISLQFNSAFLLVSLCILLQHMKGLLPGRKVIVRPRQLSDAAKLLADERPPSELRASSSLRPASASMSRERRARSSLSSSHLSKEAPAGEHCTRQARHSAVTRVSSRHKVIQGTPMHSLLS